MKRSYVIDIGSSKVSFLDASASSGALVINRFETCLYEGYSLGLIPGSASFFDAISELLSMVSKRFGVRGHTVSVGIPAPFIQNVMTSSEVNVPSGIVTENDLDNIVEHVEEIEAPNGFVLMHTTPYEYEINGLPCGCSPIGLQAKKLAARFCHAFADERIVSLVSAALEESGWRAGSFISSPMASSSFTIPFNARLNGAVLIDCGGTHCDVSAIRGNAVIRSESIGIGGTHFEQDIAYAFNISPSAAAELKHSYCFGLDYAGSAEPVHVPSEPSILIDPCDLQFIIESRAEEFADMLKDALDKIENYIPAGSPVYMVGGGIADIRRYIDYLSYRTGRNIIDESPKAGNLQGIRHAPTLALSHFMLYDGDIDESSYSMLESGANHIWDSVKEFFNMGLIAHKK